MVGNERGGRKEAVGIWGWKIETLEPGQKAVLEYSLSILEKGDWTETGGILQEEVKTLLVQLN